MATIETEGSASESPSQAEEELPKLKGCIECATQIPFEAKKCSKCGSFQDWRRFVVLGQTNVALILSVIAIATAVFGNWSTMLYAVRDFVSPTKFKIELGIVKVEDKQITALVQNRDSKPIAIEQLACFLFLPIDSAEFARRRLETRWEDVSDYKLMKKDAIGSFMIGYFSDQILSLRPGGDSLVVFEQRHIVPPRPGLDKSTDTVQSTCMLFGIESGNEIRAGGAFIETEALSEIDLPGLIERADYSEAQEPERDLILKEIETRRAANKAARN